MQRYEAVLQKLSSEKSLATATPYDAAKRSELCMLRILDSTGTQNLLHFLEKSLETKPCYILMPCAVRNPNENLTAKLRSEGSLVKKK